MQSSIIKRSVVVEGHKTSVSLEDAFWRGLKEISKGLDMTLSRLIGDIDGSRLHGNLSSAIRLFVLDHFSARASRISQDGAEAAVGMRQGMHDGVRSQQMNGGTNANE
jgi:predicted DNA-binding ribbon-helix-helix protein